MIINWVLWKMLNRIVLNIEKDGNTYLGNKMGYKECQNTTKKNKIWNIRTCN